MPYFSNDNPKLLVKLIEKLTFFVAVLRCNTNMLQLYCYVSPAGDMPLHLDQGISC